MRDRTYARRNGYDCFCFHLLCAAVQRLAAQTAQGYDCFIYSETYGPLQQSVYYLAHKNLNQLTRAERGCWETSTHATT